MEGNDAGTRLEWMAVRLVEVYRYFPEWADRIGLIGLSSYLEGGYAEEFGSETGQASDPPAPETRSDCEQLRSTPALLLRWRAWRIRRRESDTH